MANILNTFFREKITDFERSSQEKNAKGQKLKSKMLINNQVMFFVYSDEFTCSKTILCNVEWFYLPKQQCFGVIIY